MRKKLSNVSLCFALAFGMATTGAFAAQGGSIGQGDFSVMKGDKPVDKLSGQNPIQDESMLVCDGKCMVKSEGISLVAADQAKFAIKNEKDTFRLFLREGSVDYVITDKARKIAFHTPEGVYSVAEIVFNAASNPVVRGSVAVNKDGKTEISVKEGRLTFATADGMKSVGANEKIVLAIAQVGAGAAGAAGAGGAGAAGAAGAGAAAAGAAGAGAAGIGAIGLGTIAAGVVVAGVATASAVVVANNNKKGATPAIPATPGTHGTPAIPATPAIPPTPSRSM